MKAFVITLFGNDYSEKAAARCIESAKAHGFTDIHYFTAINHEQAPKIMLLERMKWTWADNNTKKIICPTTGLKHFPYDTKDLRRKIACSMSHFLLWKKCVELNEPIIILEHDAYFLSAPPGAGSFKGICQINDPMGSFSRGRGWSNSMRARGTIGAHPKTQIKYDPDDKIPDGLAGNSAYMIEPWAAADLVKKMQKIGVWPNDAFMCRQLFPYLQEYYPFVTKVMQTKSTTQG